MISLKVGVKKEHHVQLLKKVKTEKQKARPAGNPGERVL
jgi:hypothetical protein